MDAFLKVRTQAAVSQYLDCTSEDRFEILLEGDQVQQCPAWLDIDKQIAKGTTAGGGPKAGELGPTNCDKFFGAPGKP